jgi:hypothetical protein
LERLDWFYTSVSWSLSYPNTTVSSLAMETSDHASYVISIGTISQEARFENYWMKHKHFMDVFQHGMFQLSKQMQPKSSQLNSRFSKFGKLNCQVLKQIFPM